MDDPTVNFETRMEVLGGGNVDYGRYPAVSLRTHPSAGRRRQDWTSTFICVIFTSTDIGLREHYAWYTVAV